MKRIALVAALLSVSVACEKQEEPEENWDERIFDAFTWLNHEAFDTPPPAATADGPPISSSVPESWFESPGSARYVTGQDVMFPEGSLPNSLLVSMPGLGKHVEITQGSFYGPAGYPWRVDFYSNQLPYGDYEMQLQLKSQTGAVSQPISWMLHIIDEPVPTIYPYQGWSCQDITGLYPRYQDGLNEYPHGCFDAEELLCWSETGDKVCSDAGMGRCVSYADLQAHLDGLTDFLPQADRDISWRDVPTTEPSFCN